ncbi:hypothetical protein [Cytobacillus firmus]|nr:hypothetical protein [Cytobacillus firmus]
MSGAVLAGKTSDDVFHAFPRCFPLHHDGFYMKQILRWFPCFG